MNQLLANKKVTFVLIAFITSFSILFSLFTMEMFFSLSISDEHDNWEYTGNSWDLTSPNTHGLTSIAYNGTHFFVACTGIFPHRIVEY